MPELSSLGSTIKTAYESQSNTNAFTDAEKLRLASLDFTLPDLQAAFLPKTDRGIANGVASLDASGKVPMTQLNVSGLQFKGAWNPNTNTPAIVDGTGTAGDFYKASHAGSFNAGNGNFTYAIGDWVIFAGGIWQRLGSADAVSMVNGKVGDVVLTAADVGALPSDYTPPAQSWNDLRDKPTIPSIPAIPKLNYANRLPNRVANTWYQNTGNYDRIVHIVTNYMVATSSSAIQMRKIGTTAPTFSTKGTAIDTVSNNQPVHAIVPSGWEYRFVPGGARTLTEWFEGDYS
ncbi:tail protein [Agrobacterium phage Atu_ph02]|uniref:Tail fiber protein n=1 Tax=Agrobacterium phage Atu_ph02 TaxID=2024261 RepID=A0A223VZM2_9CAUD|nr:tail protein [Agrobacterium phage Atu_ph02]ASV44574.1 tail fiber protein [Agrobacterium phage Atu_ph02]